MANVIKHKRGSGSDPSASNLVIGELAIRTDNGKLFTKMDSGAIAEIAGGGSDIAINTLSSSSATGGGSATFNGSAYRFTLSSPPSVSAQQLLVSVNGVIQKPVAGTGQPSEGFSVDGNDIIFGDAPATGADFFILTFRSLGVSEPADNSVTSAKIVNGAIVNADINASAAIAGTKISPNFGGQNIITSGTIGSSNITITNSQPFLSLQDSDNENDFEVGNAGGLFRIRDVDAATNRLTISSAGVTTIAGNLDVGAGIDVTGGDITGSGDLILSSGQIRATDQIPAIFKHAVTGATACTVLIGNNTQTFAFAADSNGFSINDHTNTNQQRLFIDTSGNVGIGTNNPASTLHLDASGGAVIQLQRTSSNASNRLLISHDGTDGTIESTNDLIFRTGGGIKATLLDTGKLGIGTTTPNQRLHLKETEDCNIQIESGRTTTTDNIGALQFKGGSTDAALIQVLVDGSIKFRNTNALHERMRIDGSGRVGIALTPTTEKLEVAGAIRSTGASANFNAGSEGTLVDFDTGNNLARFGHVNGASGSARDVVFLTGGIEKMRINSDGDVLIGRTTTIDTSEVLGIKGPSGDHCTFGLTTNGTTDSGIIAFNDNDANFRGQIRYQHSSDSMQFFTNGANERLRILSSGSITTNANTSVPTGSTSGFGFTSDQFYLSYTGTSANYAQRFYNGNGLVGSILVSGSSTTYNTSSDYRLKENVVTLSDGISRLKQLKPYRFNFIADKSTTFDGFFAHEVQAIVPESATGVKDEVESEDNTETNTKKGDPIYQQIDQSKLVPLLVAALQEAVGRIEVLEAK